MSITEDIAALKRQSGANAAAVVSLSENSLLGVIFAGECRYGCKVTEGASSPLDMTIRLQGQAPGDGAATNPELAATPASAVEFPNICFSRDGGIYMADTTAEIATAPGAGLGRFDIAYLYRSKTSGFGFAVQTGTPSSAAKTEFDTNGVPPEAYNTASPNFDPTLPKGAVPVGRIYVGPSVTSISNSVIADIRQAVSVP